MELYHETLQFQKLSINYREAVADMREELAQKIYKQIQSLVMVTVDRLRVGFRIKLEQKVSKIQEGKGIPIIGMSMQSIMNGKNKFTSLNINAKKQMNGINILLDYSGSMWFTNKDFRDSEIDGILRIYAQNFIALCIVGLISKMNKNSRILVTAFCQTAETLMDIKGDFMSHDWDSLIIHNEWSSGVKTNNNLMPKQFKYFQRNWFNNEYVYEAVKSTITKFEKTGKVNNFMNILLTDGGLSRMGETAPDGEAFLKKQFNRIKNMSTRNISSFIFIKQQSITSEKLCKEYGINYTVINEKSELERAFIHLTSLVNTNLGGRK